MQLIWKTDHQKFFVIDSKSGSTFLRDSWTRIVTAQKNSHDGLGRFGTYPPKSWSSSSEHSLPHASPELSSARHLPYLKHKTKSQKALLYLSSASIPHSDRKNVLNHHKKCYTMPILIQTWPISPLVLPNHYSKGCLISKPRRFLKLVQGKGRLLLQDSAGGAVNTQVSDTIPPHFLKKRC